jgi:hypothetical protein
MDSCGVVRDAVIVKRTAGVTGRFVFRLISIYLASSAPAFALDQGGVSASAQRDTEHLLLASLDPKHDNHRDDDNGDRDHGRDHHDRDDDHHRSRDDDHDHDHRSGGGSCPRDPTYNTTSTVWGAAV